MPSPLALAPVGLETVAALRATVGDHPFVTFVAIAIFWRVSYAVMHLAPRATSDRTAAAVGAIGISGMSGAQDGQIAKAGVDALSK